MPYDLKALIGWTRRSGGDVVTSTTQQVTADGTSTLKVNDDGSITVSRLLVAGSAMDPSAYAVDGNIITFDSPPVVGLNITIVYTRSRYTDDEILSFILDGVQGVKADMNLALVVDQANGTVDDAPGKLQLKDQDGVVRPRLEQLFVLRAAWALCDQKSGAAYDDAVKIRDGDTSIDTHTTADATAKTVKRKQDAYNQALKTARTEGFLGAGMDAEGPGRLTWGLGLYFGG